MSATDQARAVTEQKVPKLIYGDREFDLKSQEEADELLRTLEEFSSIHHGRGLISANLTHGRTISLYVSDGTHIAIKHAPGNPQVRHVSHGP